MQRRGFPALSRAARPPGSGSCGLDFSDHWRCQSITMHNHITESCAVVGGDMRIAKAAGLLAESGFEVKVFGLDNGIELGSAIKRASNVEEAVVESRFVLLPIPLSQDSLTITAPLSCQPVYLHELFSAASPGQLLLGGMVTPTQAQKAREKGLKLIDYYKREELIVRNAIPTAEGAIQIAMAETTVTLHGAKCLLTGFGRVSRVLAAKLAALGAKVTVASRRVSDSAWCDVYGYRHVNIACLADAAAKADVVFNSVPALLFDRPVLKKMKRDTVIVDLASKPGGVDYPAAEELGVKSILALSLPGKVAPATAGAIIKDAVMNILEEETPCQS